jgi:hypothetical protein
MDAGRERQEAEMMLKRFPVVTRGESFEAIDVVGDRGDAEEVVTIKQTCRDLVLDDDSLPDVLETPITLRGITIARFVRHRIAELSQYWEEMPLRESLCIIPAD